MRSFWGRYHPVLTVGGVGSVMPAMRMSAAHAMTAIKSIALPMRISRVFFRFIIHATNIPAM
ncbi:MAG: hypothetical protein WC586_04750 [Methanoregula sp.]